MYILLFFHICFSFSVMFFFEPIGYSFVVVGSRNMFVVRGTFVVCVVVGCIVDVVAFLTCTVLRSALFSCIFCRFRSLRGKRLSGQGEICCHSVGSVEFFLHVDLGELGPCSGVLCTGFFRTMGLLVVYLCKCFSFSVGFLVLFLVIVHIVVSLMLFVPLIINSFGFAGCSFLV